MKSSQVTSSYSSEDTEDEIRERIKNREEWGYSDETIEYLEECITYLDNEHEYLHYAHDNMPSRWDCEDIIFIKKMNGQLEYIFDAFEEICKRLKESESKN